MMEVFVYQCVYTLQAVACSRVYARKLRVALLGSQIVKLLIQSALTIANRTKGPVYKQHPIWG
jgi:hypothetical protein